VLCRNCSANLPEGSEFCLKCGKPISPPAAEAALPAAAATLACAKCGASLPEGAQFCVKCGKPVSSPAKAVAVADRSAANVPPAELLRPRRKRRIVPWLLLVALIAAIAWVASSDNPFAQGIQELAGWKHDRTILDSSFSIGPHTFRYYKFALPEGSVNVAVVGQFAVVGDGHSGSNRLEQSRNQDRDSDNGIEVYVLSEAAFTIWQNGYATSSLYESGRVAEGAIRTDLPAGAGIYYLVFSNKFAPKATKNVRATVLLRYKSWLPEWFRQMKDRFRDWMGL
jgi:ribosomal protein L40E